MSNNATKEPLIRLAKRDGMPFWQRLIVRIIAILLALFVSALFIYFITKLNPVDVYKTMWDGAFGGTNDVVKQLHRNVTLRDICTLLLLGIALAPAFKMRFWNCGAEGQMLMGAVATAYIMINFGDKFSNNWVLLIVMLLASIVAGGIWGLIPAVFKAFWNTNETLFTLMMNYVAIQITSYCVALWENPYGSNTVGIINQQTKSGWFPELFEQKYALNLIFAIVATIAMFVYLRHSKHGYEISVVGESENTAKYAGISVKKVIIRTMIISGAICGIAGFVGVAGVDHTISTGTAGGRGFTAIIVAWLAKFNTFVMVAITLLIIFLDRGAAEIASKFSLNEYAADIITAIILFFILGCEFFINYQLHFRGKRKEA
jgi:simple sugar transport system permease protein